MGMLYIPCVQPKVPLEGSTPASHGTALQAAGSKLPADSEGFAPGSSLRSGGKAGVLKVKPYRLFAHHGISKPQAISSCSKCRYYRRCRQ